MVDRYWRKIESVENDIENSLQISSTLLKLKGYHEKINDLDNKNENSISSNLSEIKNVKNDMTTIIRKKYFDETYIISKFSKSYNNYKIFGLNLDNQFRNDGILKIYGKCNYIDNINNFSHLYKFYNNSNKFKEIILNHKNNLINDEFEIKTSESSQIKVFYIFSK